MSTVSRGTSMQASSRSNEAPVNELTFNESERVASGLPAARNWRKLKGVELCSTRGPDPPSHSLPHQENFFPPSMPWRCRPAFLTLFLFRNQALLIPATGRASGRFYAGVRLWGTRFSSFLGILGGEIFLKKIGVLSSLSTTAASCCSLYPSLAVVAG
jgi:hypothetical protein